MKKSAYYSDLFFAFFTTAVFLLCLLRYLRFPLFAAFLVAFLGGAAVALFLSFLWKRKKERLFLRKKEELEAEKLALHLALLSTEELKSFLRPRLSLLLDGAQPYAVNGICFARTEKEVCSFCFSPTPLAADGVLPLLSQNGESYLLFCNSLSPEGEKFCSRFAVKVKTVNEIYSLLKENGALPLVYKSERAFTQKKKRSFKMRFAKANASRFFVGGSMLLLTSLIVPFPYYYLVSGSILLCAATLIRIFGYA